MGRNGRYALGVLARACNMLDQIARERLQQMGAQEAQTAAKRQQTHKTVSED